MIIEDDDEGHHGHEFIPHVTIYQPEEPSIVHEENVVHGQEEAATAHEGEHLEEGHDGAEGLGELTRQEEPSIVHEEDVVHEQEGEHMEEGHDGAEGPGELTRYPGGPYDLFILTQYRHHLSARLWFATIAENCCAWKENVTIYPAGTSVTHRELGEFVRFELITTGSLKMIDNNLISAFVERRHSETSSFHMPFGEMTITLDDVANLLRLPIRGEFCSLPDRVFRRQCVAERFDCAARAYLLNLVGSTFFADKSHTLIDAKYLPLFRYLDDTDKYVWGTTTLVVLYDYLSDVCCYDTKQLGANVECFARINRWCYKQGKHKVHEYKHIIDALTLVDVIWRPWENYMGVIPFDDILFYTGHLRLCSTVVKYLLERCLRQFGYVQYIPSPPLPDPSRLFDVDVEWLRYVTQCRDISQASSSYISI
uniref:Protein MAIN-LIKE 1-like n=1 Tax=Cicer arietinum TaxID=3827 RepID=A0A1S2Z0G9_CICAR|nr:protein MAIN-LIKE 1-like [Cicer arietinum]